MAGSSGLEDSHSAIALPRLTSPKDYVAWEHAVLIDTKTADIFEYVDPSVDEPSLLTASQQLDPANFWIQATI